MAARTISPLPGQQNFAHSLFPGKPNPEFSMGVGRVGLEVTSSVTMAQSGEKKALMEKKQRVGSAIAGGWLGQRGWNSSPPFSPKFLVELFVLSMLKG